jgi:hypothetical protein
MHRNNAHALKDIYTMSIVSQLQAVIRYQIASNLLAAEDQPLYPSPNANGPLHVRIVSPYLTYIFQTYI